MQTAIRMAVATLAFGVLHSALASNRVKQVAGRVAGDQQARHVYRLFFVSQSVASFALLVRYGAQLPRHTLYRVQGPAAWMMHAGQAWALFELWRTARQAGVARLGGWTHAIAWRRGMAVEVAPPVAQGPELNAEGQLCAGAAYRWTRHPLNFLGIPIFWLTPHLTTRRLAFNLVSTAYFVLGSWHEEQRLKQAYGQPYQEYCRSGVPFFWPDPGKIRGFRSGPVKNRKALGEVPHISPFTVSNSVDNPGRKSSVC